MKKIEFDVYTPTFLYENFDDAQKIASTCQQLIINAYDLDNLNEDQRAQMTHDLLNVIVNMIIDASKQQ